MNSSPDIVFRVCLKRSFPAPLLACPVHFLTWFWFPQIVPRSGTEGHLFASFTNSLLRSRLLLKAPLRHQSCARAGKRQAGECERANRQRLPADSTSPLLKLLLIRNIANPGIKRNKNPKKSPSTRHFLKRIDGEISASLASPGLLGYKSRHSKKRSSPWKQSAPGWYQLPWCCG